MNEECIMIELRDEELQVDLAVDMHPKAKAG